MVVWLARQAFEKVTEKAMVILCNIGNEMHLRSTDLACTLAFKIAKMCVFFKTLLKKNRQIRVAQYLRKSKTIFAEMNVELTNICAEPEIVYFCIVKPLHHQLLTVH